MSKLPVPDWIKPGLVMGKFRHKYSWAIIIFSYIKQQDGRFFFHVGTDYFEYIAPIDDRYLGSRIDHPNQITANELIEKYNCSNLPVIREER